MAKKWLSSLRVSSGIVSSEGQAHLRPTLIVDSDELYLKRIEKDARKSSLPLKTARTGQNARELIRDRQVSISAIFINLNVSTAEGLSIIRLALEARPATPVYLLCDVQDGIPLQPPFTGEDLKRLAIQELIQKPTAYRDLVSRLQPVRLSTPPHPTLAPVQLSEGERKDYFEIAVDEFVSGGPSRIDLYIRLAPNHYIKVLSAGDRFESSQLERYLQKGVPHFYALRADWEKYLHFCDELAEKIIHDPLVSLSQKTTKALQYGEETISFLKSQGLSQIQIEYAHGFVNKVESIADQLQVKNHPSIRGFLENVVSYDHSVATTMVASLLASAMKLEDEISLHIVGMAALLHDVGLFQMPLEVQNEDETQMSIDQRRLYRTHPIVGAHILEASGAVGPSVVEIVRRHHERRNHKGFPVRSTFSSPASSTAMNPGIALLAEIVGVADEFTQLMRLSRNEPNFDALAYMEEHVLDGFSKSVADAFRDFFLNTIG